MKASFLLEGVINEKGARLVQVSLKCQYNGKDITAHHDSHEPLFAIIRAMILEIMREHKLDRCEATKVVNEVLRAGGLSELHVPNAAKVC